MNKTVVSKFRFVSLLCHYFKFRCKWPVFSCGLHVNKDRRNTGKCCWFVSFLPLIFFITEPVIAKKNRLFVLCYLKIAKRDYIVLYVVCWGKVSVYFLSELYLLPLRKYIHYVARMEF